MPKKSSAASRLAEGILIVLALMLLAMLHQPGAGITGYATGDKDMNTSLQFVTCTASPANMNFGALTLGNDVTTESYTQLNAAGSNAPSKLTASVTNAASWVPGFQSANTRWGILCPAAADGSASGLTNPTGYKTHKFSPSANTCRNPLGASGALVGGGGGTVPWLAQVTTSHPIFSRIKVPAGTSAGNFYTIVTFTCSEITGGAAGLSFEIVDIEIQMLMDDMVMCDGGTPNVFVAQAGKAGGPATISKSITPKIFVCDIVGNCMEATVFQEQAAPVCPNTLGGGPPDEANTPNGPDIICGTFICMPGPFPGLPGRVIIEEGPLANPAGETVQAYHEVPMIGP